MVAALANAVKGCPTAYRYACPLTPLLRSACTKVNNPHTTKGLDDMRIKKRKDVKKA